MAVDRAPRRRGVFVDLAVGMVVLGVLVGAVFPLFAQVMGVPERYAHQTSFWMACLGAGTLLGLMNWALARWVIGRRLRVLSLRLTQVGRELSAAALHGNWSSGSPEAHRLPVTSGDDLGRTAAAFNDLLAAMEAEHRFRSLLQATSDVTCLVDGDGTITFVSASVRSVLGWPPEAAVGRPVTQLVHPQDRAVVSSALDCSPRRGSQRTIVRVLAVGRVWRQLEISVTDCRDDPKIGALLLTARDITERHDLQLRLAHQAMHDSLTGLPNRAAVLERGRDLLAQAGGAPVAVVMMDLDRFKEVNDTLGHSYGDRLLSQVGPRLQALLRDGDVLARLGGDEFAVLMPGVGRKSAPTAARRLLEAFAEPFHVDGLDLDIEASIGVAVADDGRPPSGDVDGDAHAAGIDALLRQADIAMYAAKEVKTGVEVYDPHTDGHNRSRLVLLSELRRGIAEGQLVLHYQPKIALSSGCLVGVEALVRWQHPSRGLLPPAEFLPVVEQTGLISLLSDAVLELALLQARAWLDQGHPIQVAVNLSARCLHHLDLPDRVRKSLTRHGVPARLLRLELTESALMADPVKALMILQRLHADGVALSIDDFGTGYSSMSYLKRLPVDELKVDRSFVLGMASSTEDAVLVRSAVELGHNLGMTVVAEGVETQKAVDQLTDLGCDVGQGYHFARPAPASELDVWLSPVVSA